MTQDSKNTQAVLVSETQNRPVLANIVDPSGVGELGKTAQADSAGLRISLKSLGGLAFFIFLLATFWAMFISPTEYGIALEVGTQVASGLSKQAGMAPPNAKVEISPMRNTMGSVIANDIAQSIGSKSTSKSASRGSSSSSYSSDDHMSGILANAHGPEVAMAVQRANSGNPDECMVQISAQAFDHVGTPYAQLLTRIGSREDSFLVLLTHEMAHCYWNPTPSFEARLNSNSNSAVLTQTMMQLMPLVINISESYADAYSMIFAARFSKGYYARAYQGLVAFRSSKSVKAGVYNTVNAIEAAKEIAPTLPSNDNPLSVRWDVTQRYVLSAALTGGLRWLMDQGIEKEDAIKRIDFILKGQGIDFSMKSVNGKDYLIVSKAHEGFLAHSDVNSRNVSNRNELHQVQ